MSEDRCFRCFSLVYSCLPWEDNSYKMNPSTTGMILKNKITIMEGGKSAVLMKSTRK